MCGRRSASTRACESIRRRPRQHVNAPEWPPVGPQGVLLPTLFRITSQIIEAVPIDSLKKLRQRLRQLRLPSHPLVDRGVALGTFTWRRFLADNCFESAAVLSYTSLLSMVPLMVVAVSALSAVPVFQGWNEAIQEFVFRNFVPAAGDEVQLWLNQFAANANRLTAAGGVSLLVTALILVSNIESALNKIFRVRDVRRWASRFLMYWSVLSLGPLLFGGVLAASSYLFSLRLLGQEAGVVSANSLAVLPFVFTWVGLALIYVLVPNRPVRVSGATFAALVAALLFELAKLAFAWYLRTFPAHEQVYGALATVPIFLIWLYVGWSVALLGASLASSLTSFRYRPQEARTPASHSFIALLRVLQHLWRAQRHGCGLDLDALARLEPGQADAELAAHLDALNRGAIVRRTENGEWVLVRDAADLSVLDLYRLGAYPLPSEDLGKDAADPIRKRAQDWSGALQAELSVSIKELFEAEPASAKDATPDTER